MPKAENFEAKGLRTFDTSYCMGSDTSTALGIREFDEVAFQEGRDMRMRVFHGFERWTVEEVMKVIVAVEAKRTGTKFEKAIV